MKCVACGAETNELFGGDDESVRLLRDVLPNEKPPVCRACCERPIEEVARNIMDTTPLRVAMFGSRQWRNYSLISATCLVLKEVYGSFVVVYGAHHEGADAMIKRAAEARGLPTDPFPAQWSKHEQKGRKNPAGQIRNQQMARSNLALGIGFRARGKSPGTDGMRDYCFAESVPVWTIPEHASRAFLYRLVHMLRKTTESCSER